MVSCSAFCLGITLGCNSSRWKHNIKAQSSKSYIFSALNSCLLITKCSQFTNMQCMKGQEAPYRKHTGFTFLRVLPDITKGEIFDLPHHRCLYTLLGIHKNWSRQFLQKVSCMRSIRVVQLSQNSYTVPV